MLRTQFDRLSNRLVGYKITCFKSIKLINPKGYSYTTCSPSDNNLATSYKKCNQPCKLLPTALQKYTYSTNYPVDNHVTSSYRRSDLSGKVKPDLTKVVYDFKPQDDTKKKRELKPHELKRNSVLAQSNIPSKTSSSNHFSQSFKKKQELFETFEKADLSIKESNFKDEIEFSTKGTYSNDMKDFYKEHFRDRDRKLDGMEDYLKANNDLSEAPGRPLKARISPQRYWYNEDYSSPNPKEVALMSSRKVKFTMMQEAHQFRRNGNYSPEVWIALKKRTTKMLRRVDLRTLLRFLYCYASIKSSPDYYVKELIIAISERKSMMKPKHHIFYFQALSRLNWRDMNLTKFLNEMSLCWPILRNNFLIKAANSLAKLGMGNDPLCKPLIYTLNHRISTFTGKNCYLLKWIAVVELFDSEMIIKYLDQCEKHKNNFKSYSRNIQVVEIFLRLVRPDIYNKLSEHVRAFLEISRKSNTASIHQDKISNNLKELYIDTNFGGKFETNTHKKDENSLTKHPPESLDWSDFLELSNSDSKHESEASKLTANEIQDDNDNEDFEHTLSNKDWSSDLHKEISDTLYQLNINHINSVAAGPFLIDIYLPLGNFIIEAIADYQFYSETTRLTTQATRRREIVSAMGFRVITISHFSWSQLTNITERKNFLLNVLPSTLFSDYKPS